METKTCRTCEKDKYTDDFSMNGKYRRSQCRDCDALDRATAKEKMGPGEWNRKQAERRRVNPLTDMVSTAKARARDAGIPFDLKVSDLYIPEYCPILGLKLEPKPYEPGKKSAGAQPNSPSLDRIIPELGYVVGNVQVVSYLANAMKNNASSEQLHKFADWVKKEVPCGTSN